MRIGRKVVSLRPMSFVELLIIAVGLAMDAFAVAIGKGLSVCRVRPRHIITTGVWFGGFQALMPAIGYFFGNFFADVVNKCSHWIAFILLAITGGNMIKEALSKDEEEMDASMTVKSMFILAVATSIDALAMGVTYACMQVQIIWAVLFIGVVTFTLSAMGVKVGSVFGTKYKSKAEFFGGLVLLIIGIKILLEGLGIFG